MKKSHIVVLGVLTVGIIVVELVFLSSGYAQFAFQSRPWLEFDDIYVSPYPDYSTNHDYFFMVGFSALNPSSYQHNLYFNTAQLTIPGYSIVMPSWEELGSFSEVSCSGYFLVVSFDAVGNSPLTMPANRTTLPVEFTMSYSIDGTDQTFRYSGNTPIEQLPQSVTTTTSSQSNVPTLDLCKMHTQAVIMITLMTIAPLIILAVVSVFLIRKQKNEEGPNGNASSEAPAP